MKVVSIRHIFSSMARDYPSLAHKLQEQNEITRFKNAFLTPIQREQILFITIKHHKLLFAFKHQALCVEFNHYKHKFIIESLRQHKERFPLLSSIQEIKAYVPRHILTQAKNIESASQKPYYEHSNGDFINHAQNTYIHDKIEELRLGIKRRWEAQNDT